MCWQWGISSQHGTRLEIQHCDFSNHQQVPTIVQYSLANTHCATAEKCTIGANSLSQTRTLSKLKFGYSQVKCCAAHQSWSSMTGPLVAVTWWQCWWRTRQCSWWQCRVDWRWQWRCSMTARFCEVRTDHGLPLPFSCSVAPVVVVLTFSSATCPH